MEIAVRKLGIGVLVTLAALVAAMTTTTLAARAEDPPSREYQVKAAFIANFVQFVDWPDAAFAKPGDPIVITIVGDNPFGGALEKAVAGKRPHGRDVVVRCVQQGRAVGETHLMFVVSSNVKPAAVAAGGGASVLTVGDGPSFTAEGGVIRFFTEDNKMRFEVNTAAADRAGLKFSAKLLQLAKIYKEG